MSESNGHCIEVVRRELLEALAAEAPVSPSAGTNGRGYTASASSNGTANGSHANNGSGDYPFLLVERWLQDLGVEYRVKPQPDNKGRTVYVLKKCPFDSSHGDPDSCIMQEPYGKMSSKCLHSSCAGRGWKDFKDAIGSPGGEHYDAASKTKRQSRVKISEKLPTPATNGERPQTFGGYPLTDLGNAERLRERHGADLRHCHPWKRWLRFNKRYWEEDRTGAIVTCATETVRSIYVEASQAETDDQRKALGDHAQNSEAAKYIRAMIDLGRAQPGIPILPADMDTDPWLLCCRNGTLDMRTGELREHRRSDLITKICPRRYEPDAPCPAWIGFLGAIFPDSDDEPDSELITFMQRLLGRCLTGDVSEQTLPIFWGCGANGKSTLVNAVLDTIGPNYSMKANADLLMASLGDRHPTELADLFGMRLVVASETHQGRHMNEALIKDLTGGEPIRARRMREDFWQFDPTHKVVLLTNHKPRVTGTDEGIWRRLRLIPFTTTFWDPADPGKDPAQLPDHLRQDKQLGEKLKAEREGILSWLVRGCLDWQRHGMTLPEKVKVATRNYRAEEDILARWIAECCVSGDSSYRERSSKLYSAYKTWCEAAGENELSQKLFGPALEEHGYEKLVSNGVWYLGIGFRKD